MQLHVRNLTEDDVARRAATPVGSTPPPLKRIRYSHHKLARLIAQGVNQTDAGLVAGFSSSRVSILMKDPAFKALVEHYGQAVEGAFVDFLERLKSLSIDTVDELAARLEEDPDQFKNEELLKMASFAADRTGFGPATQVNHDLTPEAKQKIEALKAAVAERQRGRIIDRHAEEVVDAEFTDAAEPEEEEGDQVPALVGTPKGATSALGSDGGDGEEEDEGNCPARIAV